MSLIILLVTKMAFAAVDAKQEWQMREATISYQVMHPLHKINATTKAARGKGSCSASICEFLIAAPIKSFDSGNGNRDSHAIDAVGGIMHPFTQVRCQTASPISKNSAFSCTIELNGQTAKASPEVVISTFESNRAEVSGHFNLKLTEFKITPPTLFAVAVKDDFSVDFKSVWQTSPRR